MKNLFALSAITLTAVIVIALIFWGMTSYKKEIEISASSEIDNHFIDLYMHNFTINAMNDDGILSYTIQAEYLEHYNDQDYSTLKKPVIHLLRADSNWVISSDSGEINEGQDIIILHNEVVMTQKDSETPIKVETSKLKINTKNQTAVTKEHVHISQHNFDLDAQGMKLDNVSGLFELLSNIESTYVQEN